MIGAIAGDIIGSVYEGHPIKTTDFPLFQDRCRFTDDSVLTVAIAKAIIEGTSYLDAVREVGRRYPNAGYGGTFIQWLFSENSEPYNSWGNRRGLLRGRSQTHCRESPGVSSGRIMGYHGRILCEVL